MNSLAITSIFTLVVLLFAPASAAEEKTVSILFGGDTSYAESYQEQYAASGGANILADKGYDYSGTHLLKLLDHADYCILNLETPLTTLREKPVEGRSYYHYSDPVKSTEALKRHHVHAVSLANNHTLDYGPAALAETSRALQKYDITTFGAGSNLEAACQPLIKEFSLGEQTFRIAVFGVFQRKKSYEQYDFYATADATGACALDIDSLSKTIRELKRASPATFVVAFPHWGSNYVWRSKTQQKLAHGLIDAGADLIVGHGAHCIQEIERYRDRWILYSIGNFLFNTRGRYAKFDAPPYSMPLLLQVGMIDGKLRKSLRLYPIVSDNTKTNYQPRFVSTEEFAEASALLEKHSKKVGFNRHVQKRIDNVGHYLEITSD